MDIVYLFRVLLKRKWIIALASILAGAIAWFFTRNEAYYFRSTSRVSTGFAVPDQIRVDDKGFSLFDADIKFSQAINTWTSESVISLLSYELILHDLKTTSPFRKLTLAQTQTPIYKEINKDTAAKIFKGKLDSMSVLTSYKPDERKLLEYLTLYRYDVGSLTKYLSIYQVQRTDYIQIDCMTENPELSAFIVNHVFEQFIRYYKGIKSTISQESVDTLKSIMDKKKEDVDVINKLLRGEGGGDATTENTSKFQLITELESQLTIEKNKLTDDYYALRKINQKLTNLGVNTSSNTNSNNNEELVIARKAMNEAYAEYLNTGDKEKLNKYNVLNAEFNKKYASSTTTTTKPSDTKDQLLEKKNDLNVDIDASNDKIKAMEQKIRELKASASFVSSHGATIETLRDELKLAENEYTDAKRKYTNAFDMSASSVNNFRQQQIAQPAIGPEPSKRKLIVGMAGVATFLSTILIIVLLTYLDSSIKTPVIFSKMVNLKLISMVNFMNLKNKSLKDIVAGINNEKTRVEKKRSNVFRESIRKLRYEIESTGKKIFLFTSTKKGEGKTTLIQALSYSMSLSNKKILIVDTNFCNNDLTVQLHADPVLEKISTTDSDEPLVERIKSLSKDVSGGSIFALGSEGGDYTPSEILPHENLLQELHTLTQEFDYIFLEGPPLNDFTDSKELLQYVDGVVAIFSATHIVKQIDKESIAFFKGMDGKFCGSVLNMVNLENVNAL